MENTLTIITLVGLYFMPTMISGLRDHHNELAIFVLNLFLGWTALGWIIALVWSLTAVRKPDQNVAYWEE